MVRIIGKGIMQPYSQDISLSDQVCVEKFIQLLHLPEKLANNLLVVRGHNLLYGNEMINTDDEILLFLAAMGG